MCIRSFCPNCSEEMIDATLDHLHNDTIPKFALEAMAGDARALRCVLAFKSVLVDIGDGSGQCAACSAAILDPTECVCCSVLQFDRGEGDVIVLAIPFCGRCATTTDEVSRLAREAIKRVAPVVTEH
jgi:hypothetical protein